MAGLVGLAAGLALALFYRWYLQGADVAPDSVIGLALATAGTLLLILVGAGYALRKRWGMDWAGHLAIFLIWHVVGGLLGLLLIWMHTTGNLDESSGTATFYGLIGVVASGLVGRLLDHLCPRLAASAALQTLNARGEERLEELAAERSQRAFGRGRRQSMQAIKREARDLERAMQREHFFLWLIRAWRQVHLVLSLVAAGLLIWHLVHAATVLLSNS